MDTTPSDEAVPAGQDPQAAPRAKAADPKSEWRDLGAFLLKLAVIVFVSCQSWQQRAGISKL